MTPTGGAGRSAAEEGPAARAGGGEKAGRPDGLREREGWSGPGLADGVGQGREMGSAW
jgi:hypothetical protein